MCGIAGIIDFRGRALDRDALQRCCHGLSHRGPDDHGVFVHRADGFSVGLAHTRLAVIDPTPDAHQPMIDPAGRAAVVYNGELYNYLRLRDELPGPFRTSSDTEVVLQACSHWGSRALERFDAMWALAYVDVIARTGQLSRDPFGIKPLYYACRDDRLVFASELGCLSLLAELPADLDDDALVEYLLLGFIPHPRTIYRDVHKLPPGHVLTFDAGGPQPPQRYFQLRSPSVLSLPASSPLPYPEACRELRRRIDEAVAAQRVADVPIGAFLSGGLDSAVVVSALSRSADAPVRTFTIGYTGHTAYDETLYAELLARHCRTEHETFRLGFRDVLDAIEPLLGRLGEPFADSSLLPTALLSRCTRQHVTVALSGDGGDELFGGYWRYLGHHYLDRYHRWPALLRRGIFEPLLALAPSAKSTRWMNRLRQARKLLRGDRADPFERHLAWARHLDEEQARQLVGVTRAERAAAGLQRRYRDAARHLWPELPGDDQGGARAAFDPGPHRLGEIMLADLAVGLPADMLYKVDTASMAHSLEVRVPLLAADVVNFAAALPVAYRIDGRTSKRILRDAFADELPAEVLHRGKMGFEVPVGEFLRHELREMYQDVVTPTALGRFGLNSEAADTLFRRHLHRRDDHADVLWALLVLCAWRARS